MVFHALKWGNTLICIEDKISEFVVIRNSCDLLLLTLPPLLFGTSIIIVVELKFALGFCKWIWNFLRGQLYPQWQSTSAARFLLRSSLEANKVPVGERLSLLNRVIKFLVFVVDRCSWRALPNACHCTGFSSTHGSFKMLSLLESTRSDSYSG